MNFINKYHRSNFQLRRGMILLVVMAVLSFFAVMGMTFILMTGKNRDSAETAQLAAQNSKTAGNSPQELLEEGIMQVLVGPPNNNSNSALYGCDIIGDMYGAVDGNNLELVTASFNNNVMTPANAQYAGRVVTIAEGAYKGQSTLILNSRGAILPFASGIGSSNDYKVDSVKCVINKKRAFQGNAASYDAADISDSRNDSNDFMSLRYSGGIENSEIRVGRVVVPSYFRGARPKLDNNELGGVYPALSAGSFNAAASKNDSPWDIDNDGDGDNDSVWMNLGLPARPMPDGTLVVPLYAILVEDLDGRLNVNAHSPDVQIESTATYSSLGTATATLAESGQLVSTTMLNGQGFGPADVNLEALLGADASSVINARKWNDISTGLFDYRFPDFSTVKESEFSLPNTNYKNFRTPLDFYGVMAGAIDQNGMFVWQKRGLVGELGKSSYEHDLGSTIPKGSLVSTSPYKQFSPEELERVLRVYDDDSNKLESRLFNQLVNSDIKSVRNLITTESWDMPYCDISGIDTSALPEEIQAGFKLDINRPLTSYEDDPDTADAERTQLAKDLYQIAVALGINSKVAAQWAVNAVDFRDSDSVCTYLSVDGITVFGCERPELLITETFAFHCRMTEDSELGGWRSDDSSKCARPATPAVTYIDAEWYDKADCPTSDSPSEGEVQVFCEKYDNLKPFDKTKMSEYVSLINRVKNNNSDGIADMDQVYPPESGLFIELYNPWLSAGTQESMPTKEFNGDGNGVTLGPYAGRSDSAWRIVVADGAADGNNNTWAKDIRENNSTKDRVLYFGSSSPENGTFTYNATASSCVKPGQFAIIGPAGKTYLARNEKTGAGARPITITNGSTSVTFDSVKYEDVCAIGVPNCGNARFSVTDVGEYTDPVDNNTGKLTTPRDMPYDADNPSRWTNLCNDHGLGEDFEQEAYRVVYLQRLANPYKAYNALTNPYITFDQMPVDLFSYNGRQNSFADYKMLNKGDKASVADELPYKHADVFIKSRQRGETQIFAGSTCANFWTAEKILGHTNKSAVSSKQSLYTTGTGGRQSVTPAVKTSFYQSISKLEPNFYDLADTTVGTGTTTTAKLPSYQSAAPYYFPNRPFNSVMELMLVPQVSAYELTSSLNAIDKPTSKELTTANLPKYLYPDNGIDFLTGTGAKLLDFVRVQTPFVVTPMNVNTYYVNGNNQSVSTTAAQSGYRWSFREPGKININSITHPAVWAALLGAKSEPESKNILGIPANLYTEYWEKIFTTNPGTRPLTFGTSSANYIAANSLIFRMNDTTNVCQSAANNVYFQTQLMQRLSNLTTTRSNVFAVWVTVGFFEYQNGSVGKEYGLDNGSRQRYRAFYMIDRTRPVGYSPGLRMNADKTIILRRYLP